MGRTASTEGESWQSIEPLPWVYPQMKSHNIFDLSHRKPRLIHHFAPLVKKGGKGVAGGEGLRRDAPVQGL